eukprot:jgi/Botrbrau1/17751/Bobra.0127s0011.2
MVRAKGTSWAIKLSATCGILVVASIILLYLPARQCSKSEPRSVQTNISDDQALRELSFWDNYNFDNEALWLIPLEKFHGVALLDSDRHRRKYLWDFFLPHYSCPHKEKIGVMAGDGDNGKWVCGVRTLLQHPGCIVYSVGSNGDVSFERGILAKTHCEVHVFDPTLTPQQKAEVEKVPELHLHEYGLAANDSYVDLSGDVSKTLGKIVAGFETKSLNTILKELGHTWIDVLKIDIEGFEWEVLESLLDQPGPLPFTQLQVEYHYQSNGQQSLTQMRNVLARMITKDMRVFSTEPNTWWFNNGYDYIEYAYIQVNKVGDIVTGPPPTVASSRRLARLKDDRRG